MSSCCTAAVPTLCPEEEERDAFHFVAVQLANKCPWSIPSHICEEHDDELQRSVIDHCWMNGLVLVVPDDRTMVSHLQRRSMHTHAELLSYFRSRIFAADTRRRGFYHSQEVEIEEVDRKYRKDGRRALIARPTSGSSHGPDDKKTDSYHRVLRVVCKFDERRGGDIKTKRRALASAIFVVQGDILDRVDTDEMEDYDGDDINVLFSETLRRSLSMGVQNALHLLALLMPMPSDADIHKNTQRIAVKKALTSTLSEEEALHVFGGCAAALFHGLDISTGASTSLEDMMLDLFRQSIALQGTEAHTLHRSRSCILASLLHHLEREWRRVLLLAPSTSPVDLTFRRCMIESARRIAKPKDDAIHRAKWQMLLSSTSKQEFGAPAVIEHCDVTRVVDLLNRMDCDVHGERASLLDLSHLWSQAMDEVVLVVQHGESGSRRRGSYRTTGVASADDVTSLLVFCLVSCSTRHLYSILLLMQAASKWRSRALRATQRAMSRFCDSFFSKEEKDICHRLRSATTDCTAFDGDGDDDEEGKDALFSVEEEDYRLVTYEVCVEHLASLSSHGECV